MYCLQVDSDACMRSIQKGQSIGEGYNQNAKNKFTISKILI